MIDVINASTGQSFISEIFVPEVLTGRYGTGFALGLIAKDVRIAQQRHRGRGRRRPGDHLDRRALGRGPRATSARPPTSRRRISPGGRISSASSELWLPGLV